MMRKIVLFFVCLTILASSCLSFASCSKPPEYSEIEQRFKWLVEESAEINKVLFGEGLPTHERVYDPWEHMEVYKPDSKTYIYYCYIQDKQHGEILAYRQGFLDGKKYLRIENTPDASAEAVYVDSENARYYYLIDGYQEPVSYYYTSQSPLNYDYVTLESPYHSISEIKSAAERVYSKDYLENSVYMALFTGASASDDLAYLYARYIEYYDARTDKTSFMMSNDYEPLITETRVFDFSTAQMVRPSNKKLVSIRIESYLPSDPNNRLTVTLTMVNQDGQWFLDSATY